MSILLNFSLWRNLYRGSKNLRYLNIVKMKMVNENIKPYLMMMFGSFYGVSEMLSF